MKIQDYIEILKFILDQQDCHLNDDSLKDFIDLLFEVPINHRKIKEFLYYIISSESLEDYESTDTDI